MISKLLGTKSSIKEQLATIDTYKVPEEEKIKMRLKVFDYYTPFKIAQRYLAVIIAMTYVLAIFLTVAYHYVGLDYKGIITIVSAFQLGLVMLSVVSFYLGGGAVESFKNKPDY